MISPGRREFLTKLPYHLLEKIRNLSKNGIFALDDTKSDSVKDPVARIDVSLCHAWAGLSCQQCYLACPRRDEALEIRDQKPVIVWAHCDGCKICVDACKTVNDLPAVQMVSRVTKMSYPAEKEVLS